MSTVNLSPPSLLADFTTEGSAAPLYLLSGSSFNNFASWLTAISGSFSRGSTAYYTNSSGLLTQAASGQIRFDYNPVTLAARGLLLEGAGTNLAPQSNTFSDATWTATAATLAQNVTGPDGVSNSAWTITDSAANSTHRIFQTLTLSATTTYTESLYVKHTNHQYIALRAQDGAGNNGWVTFDLVNGVVSGVTNGSLSAAPTGTITQFSNGWFFITVTFTSNVGGGGAAGSQVISLANSANYSEASYVGTGTDTVLLYGYQFEAASFASSYIPTTSGSANRTADSLTATPITSWYNSTSGTLYVSADAANPGTNSPALLAINDVAGNNIIGLAGASSGLIGVGSSGGGLQAEMFTTDGGQSGYVANVSSRSGISGVANSWIYVRDAGTADTVGGTSPMPVTPTELSIGSWTLSASPLYGHIAGLGYWPTAFDAPTLKAITQAGATFSFFFGPGVVTTLTRVPGKFFTKKQYHDLLDEIREEVIAEQEAIGGLDEIGRADREYDIAQRALSELESKLTPTNYARVMDARERLEAARKARDHHYFMDIVNKEWAKYSG